jgi:hypothetical protein
MAAVALAERTGTAMQDPEPWITAPAITGLWPVYFRTLRWHVELADPAEVGAAVQRDLDTAVGILRRGGTGRIPASPSRHIGTYSW